MIRKDINDIYESLKRTMDAQLQASKELQRRMQELKTNISAQEEQLCILDAMRAQLQANIKADREELKELTESANKRKLVNLYEKLVDTQEEKQEPETNQE